MVNCNGGRYRNIPFKVPDGWMIVKQYRGITTIKPINDVHSQDITKKHGADVGGVGL